MQKQISAVICTLNRSNYLQKAISSLADQDLKRDAYEIVVVDNGSTDNTRSIVEHFSPIGNIRYLYEPALGLSHARNRGWKEAAAPYVAYLDDDAIATPKWLGKILNVFETVKSKLGCVGGKVNPIWEGARPDWLGDEIVCSLTVVDWSDSPHVLNNLNSEWLAGANIAFPRELLNRLNGFSPYLDRVGSRMLSSGDVFLEKQIQRSGHTCFYHPEVEVSHHIPVSRLTQAWFIRRYYYQGISDAVMHLLTESLSTGRRMRAALQMAKCLLGEHGMMNLLRPTRDPKRFVRKCLNLITLGHVFGLLTLPRYRHGGTECP